MWKRLLALLLLQLAILICHLSFISSVTLTPSNESSNDKKSSSSPHSNLLEKYVKLSCIPQFSAGKLLEKDENKHCSNAADAIIPCVNPQDMQDLMDYSGIPIVGEMVEEIKIPERKLRRRRKLEHNEEMKNNTKSTDNNEQCIWRSLEVVIPTTTTATPPVTQQKTTTSRRLQKSTNSTTAAAHPHNHHSAHHSTPTFITELLQFTFDMADRHDDIRRLYIVYYRHDHHRIQSLLEKQFLHHITWWHIVRESYLHYGLSAASLVNLPTSKANLAAKAGNKIQETMMEVLLEKVPPSTKPLMQSLSSTQFPSETICQNATMLINHGLLLHPGLAGEIAFMSGSLVGYPYAVFGQYSSSNNRPTDITAMITGSDCPNTLNKWECALYPTTNCTFPSILTSCRTTNCVQAFSRDFAYSVVMFPATANGTVMKEEKEALAKLKESSTEPRTPQQEEYWTKHRNTALFAKYRISHRNSLRLLQSPHLDHSIDSIEPKEMKALGFLKLTPNDIALFEYFLFRYNHFYRSMIQSVLLNFTLTNQVNFFTAYDLSVYPHSHEKYKHRITVSDTPKGSNHTATSHGNSKYVSIYEEVDHLPKKSCVAAHIRRGDRMVYDVNMTDFCLHMPQDSDKGCYGVPLGVVTLKSVLKHAEWLVNTSVVDSVIAITDDDAWLEEEIRHLEVEQKGGKIADGLKSRWKVYSVPPLTPPYAYNESVPFELLRGGTNHGVHFHASLELLQQCEAVVGHFESSVAFQIYALMCLRHRNHRNICPPMYDMRWGL